MKSTDILNRITTVKRSQQQQAINKEVSRHNQLLSVKVKDCGSWLHLREWISSGESRLVNANFCKKHMLCRACAVRRAVRRIKQALPKVEKIMAENPKLIPVMITRTVRNGSDLQERLNHLKKSHTGMLAAVRRFNNNPFKNNSVEWCKVKASIRSLEVTKSKDGSWHPHDHTFALIDSYIDQEFLSSEWKHFTRDSFVVGVSRIKGTIIKGLCEVMKYSLKFSSMPPADVWLAYESLLGTRMTDCAGLLRGLPEPDIDEDEIEPELTGETRDFIASWAASHAGFILRPATEFEEATFTHKIRSNNNENRQPYVTKEELESPRS